MPFRTGFACTAGSAYLESFHLAFVKTQRLMLRLCLSNLLFAVAFWLLVQWNVIVVFFIVTVTLFVNSIAPIVYAKVNVPVALCLWNSNYHRLPKYTQSLCPALTVIFVLCSHFAASGNHVLVFFFYFVSFIVITLTKYKAFCFVKRNCLGFVSVHWIQGQAQIQKLEHFSVKNPTAKQLRICMKLNYCWHLAPKRAT